MKKQSRQLPIGFVNTQHISGDYLRSQIGALDSKLQLTAPLHLSPLQRIRIWLRQIILDYDTSFIELLSGFITCLWAIWVILPQFDAYQTQVFFYMRFMSEWAWGGLFAVLGALQFFSQSNKKKAVRCISTMASFSCWFVVWVLFMLADWRVPALLPLTLSLMNAWAYLRLAILE